MMMDWNAYRKQLGAAIAAIGKTDPDLVRGYRALTTAHTAQGALDPKTRELVALAVAVTLRCDGCITSHVEQARRHGATADEITDALGVAVMVNAGAALVYSARTLDAFQAATAEASAAGAAEQATTATPAKPGG